jgi:hypothetical protein
VDVQWSPEPTSEEREALELALACALAERSEPRSHWWREGVLESVSPEPETDAQD